MLPPGTIRPPVPSRRGASRSALAGLLLVGLLRAASAKDTLAPAAGPRHHLVQGGRTVAMIVLPAKPEMLEGYAAGELQKYVKEITGRILPIINEPEKGEGAGDYNEPQKLAGYGIWLGQTKAAEAAHFTLTEAKLGRDGYATRADDHGLIVEGRDPLGTLFGVYDIIEREFGVRWFEPDEQQRLLTPERKQIWVEQEPIGEVVPRAESVSVGTFQREFKPSFEERWVREGDWALHNRMNVWVRANGQTVGVNCKWYGHTFGTLIPPEKYFQDHPEWFALVKGKRQGHTDPERLGHDSQLCTSNPEVIDKLAQGLIEAIEADPTIEIISLAPNDGGGFCECERCTALDGPPYADGPGAGETTKSPDAAGVLDGRAQGAPPRKLIIPPGQYSNRMAILYNEVARRVGQRFPKVKIKVFAYGYYALPPKISGFHLEPNLMVQVVGTSASLKPWASFTDQLGIYKVYAVAAWGKVHALRGKVTEMREEIPALRDEGVKFFYTQSMQQPWPECPLNHYIAAKLVWNADLDVDWLINDYCDKFFEKASAPMHEYLLAIEQVTTRYEASGVAAYDEATRDRLRSFLDQARQLADSEVVRQRVAALRGAFDACEASVLHPPEKKVPAPAAGPASVPVNAQSASGLEYYSQGGIVANGIAYFTANDHSVAGTTRTTDYPCVMAMDVKTMQVVKRYHFSFTYDSSPLVYSTKDGTPLIIAHEYQKARTLALHRDTGEVAWTSAANQPGALFFGYSQYLREDGSRLILMAAQNGLHAMSGGTGEDVWQVKLNAGGGITPAVDQSNGWVFYQGTGRLCKIDARTGAMLKSVAVPIPSRCAAWNTVLTADVHGSYVATYWISPTDANEAGSAIRVYDEDLNLVWEKTGIPAGKKATLTYANGKLVTGSGNGWGARYPDDRWKYIAAYAIETGAEVWRCDLTAYTYTCILNVPYFNGCFFAETQDDRNATPGVTSKVFRIDGATGKLEEVLDYGQDHSSCATCIIAHGKLFSGDLVHDRLVVTELATGSSADWPGPFGDPQRNQMALPDDPHSALVPMRQIVPAP